MSNWKSILKNRNEYKNYTYLETPETFSELFKNKTIPYVQLRKLSCIGNTDDLDYVTFGGTFEWRNDIITPIDTDDYATDMLVYGYCWFDRDDNTKGLYIIVKE